MVGVALRYLTYLIASFIMQLVAWIVTPILPLFAVKRIGGWDNNSYQAEALRLPLWLSWFDTPDNPLVGDTNWILSHPEQGYWSMVGWLYRNSLYGFKWSVLSAPMSRDDREISGPSPTWKTPGFHRIRMNGYWQWHLVKKIGPVTINWNFGWLLNDGGQERALFMFSPRIRLA